LKDLAVEGFGTNNPMRSRRKQMGCRKSRTPWCLRFRQQ